MTGGEPSIGPVRRLSLALALGSLVAVPQDAMAAPAVLVLDGDRVTVRHDRFLPPADPLPAAPATRTAAPVARAAAASTRRALRTLLDTAAIDQPTYDARVHDYDDAQAALAGLTGVRRAHLRAAVGEVDRVAARGELTAARLPMAFETIRRNRQWWTSGPLLGGGRRVSFTGSRMVWQMYPGAGLQLQWLGTFGKANALWRSGEHDPELRELLTEARALAAPRAGGLGFESWFSFDGGRPPWVSGLSAGTGAQAFARAAIRLGEPAFFEAGRGALGVFAAAPPEGVRVDTAPGQAHYLIYSFAPRLRVLNAFAQAVNGLHDFAELANDQPARDLFTAGEARLRQEVPSYDTGAWSLYSETRESNLSYHRLLRDFLLGLCERVTEDSTRGGTLDASVYCTTAAAFTEDLRTAPAVVLHGRSDSARPRARRRVAVAFDLDKVSAVTTEVTFGGVHVGGRTTLRRRGRHHVVFTPRRRGTYRIAVRAVDLAGNSSAAARLVRVGSAPR
jgi:hypothetical protein